MGNVFVFLKVTEQLDKLIELAIFEFKVVYECETIAYFAEHNITWDYNWEVEREAEIRTNN